MAKSTPAPTATWKISQLERVTSDGYVYTAHYTVDVEDGTYRAGAYGSVGFERPETLIPFADLTEEQVIEWVKEALGADKVLEIGKALLAQLEEQRQPTKAVGVPWVS